MIVFPQGKKRLVFRFKTWCDDNMPRTDGVAEEVHDEMLRWLVDVDAVDPSVVSLCLIVTDSFRPALRARKEQVGINHHSPYNAEGPAYVLSIIGCQLLVFSSCTIF